MADAIKPMTSRQRVLAALNREPVDRTPVCNPTSVATVELMDLVDSVMDDETAHEMAKLASLMSQFLPRDDMDQRYPFMGEE